jgi:hypothetical protein
MLNQISDCCNIDLSLGLNTFVERAYVWTEGYNILIRYNAVSEDCFESLISAIKRLNKHWKLVERADEPFFLIYSSNDEK